jgi:hypothetical protein
MEFRVLKVLLAVPKFVCFGAVSETKVVLLYFGMGGLVC